MKLAAQTYTIREFTKTESEIATSLKKLKDIGYNAVQLSACGPFRATWMKDELDRLGMQACVTHTPIDRIVNETDTVIEEHRIMGMKYIGIGYKYFDTLKDCDAFIQEIKPAAERIHNAGLKLLYHNHAHEFLKIDGESLLERLLSAFTTDTLGMIADLYWVQTAGASPEKFLRDHAGRIPVVHFKDRKVALINEQSTETFAEIFEGNMDYDSIYRVCLETGVEWVAVEQDSCDGDPFHSLKTSFDNIKQHGLFPS